MVLLVLRRNITDGRNPGIVKSKVKNEALNQCTKITQEKYTQKGNLNNLYFE